MFSFSCLVVEKIEVMDNKRKIFNLEEINMHEHQSLDSVLY